MAFCMLRNTPPHRIHRQLRMALHSKTVTNVGDSPTSSELAHNPLLAKYVQPVVPGHFPHSGVLLSKFVWRSTFSTGACLGNADKQAEEYAEDLKRNPFFDKYADKINERIKTEPDSGQRPANVRRPVETENEAGKRSIDGNSSATSGITARQRNKVKQQTRSKSLKDIIKLDLLRDKSAAEIGLIWNSRYSEKAGSVSAVKPADAYAAECHLAAEYPTFLLPVPREQGVEFFVLQWNGDEVHFTSLISYQAHGENTPQCMSLYHYTELESAHKIVLMQGEYDTAVFKPMEAQCLVNQLQLYYNNPDEVRRSLLETFHRRPAEFQHMRLVEEMTRFNASQPLSSRCE